MTPPTGNGRSRAEQLRADQIADFVLSGRESEVTSATVMQELLKQMGGPAGIATTIATVLNDTKSVTAKSKFVAGLLRDGDRGRGSLFGRIPDLGLLTEDDLKTVLFALFEEWVRKASADAQPPAPAVEVVPPAPYTGVTELATFDHREVVDFLVMKRQGRVSQEDIAALCGVGQTKMSKYERHNDAPSIRLLVAYAKALGYRLGFTLTPEADGAATPNEAGG